MINSTGNRMTREIHRQSRLASDIAVTQTQISTSKRIQKASDDPVASSRVATVRGQQANAQSWSRNVTLGTALTSQADTVLSTVSDLLARGQELTLAAANPSANAADRATIALEISSIADEIDMLSASKSTLGGPLFSTGNPMAMRFDDQMVFAPLPSRSSAFEVGGVSVSQHLRDVNTAIATGDSAQIAAAIPDVTSAIDHIANTRAAVGIQASRLEQLRETQASNSIAMASERSTLEDTDLSSAIAKLNGQTITLEAAQAAFARINRRTLMDILG